MDITGAIKQITQLIYFGIRCPKALSLAKIVCVNEVQAL